MAEKKTRRAALVRRTTPERKNLELVYVPVEKLRLWDKNPRENDEAAELLCEMLDSHGFINPIIATRDNVVRAGNTRLKSARLKKMETVPVIYVDFDSEFDAEMYSIADNKTHEFALWKKGLLAALLQQRKSLDKKVVAQKSGFSPLEIEKMRIVADREEDLYKMGPREQPVMGKAVFWYAGGKSYEAKWILSYMPPHKVYVEVFSGAANILFAKPPAPFEILNDIDGNLVNFYRVLRSKKLFPLLIEQIQLTLTSRKDWMYARDLLKTDEGGKVKRAWAYLVMVGLAFGGKPNSWNFAITASVLPPIQWIKKSERLVAAHARLRNCQIDCVDFRRCLKTYDQPGTLLYLDPPYMLDTRTEKHIYGENEMKTEDHEELLELLLKYPESALLSGYEHPLYERLKRAGWLLKKRVRTTRLVGSTRATGIRGPRARFRQRVKTECLWINPVAQAALAKARRAARRVKR